MQYMQEWSWFSIESLHEPTTLQNFKHKYDILCTPLGILLVETLQKEERAGGNSRHVEHQGGGAIPDYSNSVVMQFVLFGY